LRAPRLPVTVEALDRLGVIVVSGQNPEDVAKVLAIIDFIARQSKQAEIQIRMVRLDFADATAVVNILSQIYGRVNISPAGYGTQLFTPRTQTTQSPFGSITQSIAQPPSVALVPVPRFNAIFVAAPGAVMDDIVRRIKELDAVNDAGTKTTAFPLKNASASRVGQTLTNFYGTRYGGEGQGQHQIRFTWNDPTN